MKFFIPVLCVAGFLICEVKTSCAQDVVWAYSFEEPTNVREGNLGISTNGKDRIVISGRGIKGVNLDVKSGGTGYDSDNAFIAVYDQSGAILWAVPAADPANFKQYAWNVHMNSAGEVYSFGRYSGILDFDPTSGKDEVQASDQGSMYIQKFDADGKYLWVKVLPIFAIPYQIAERSNGNILVAGKMNGDTVLTISGKGNVRMSEGIFMVEIDKDGTLVNAGSGYGGFNTSVKDLAIDHDDNIILCGGFDGVVDFDLGAATKNDTANRAIDAYVVMYDKDFNLKWQKRYGDVKGNVPSWDWSTGLAVGENNEIYVTGRFTYTTDFDPDANPGKCVLDADLSAPSPDGCILQYDQSGALQWVKQLGGDASYMGYNKDVEILHVALENDNLYVSGSLTGVGDFDPSSDTAILKADDGATTMFFGQYDLDGSYKTAFIIDDTINSQTGSGVEEVNGMVVFKGALYAYGRFQKAVDFDPGAKQHILSTDANGSLYGMDFDIYMARWDFEKVGNNAVQIHKESGYNIYPNPVQDKLTVTSLKKMSATYELYDLGGRLITTGIIQGVHHEINMSQLLNGVYILQIEGQYETLSQRVIVSKQ